MREQRKNTTHAILDNTRVPSSALTALAYCYKIKLRRIGYRLVYRVDDDVVFVTVIGVGKRDKQKVYELAQSRLRTVFQKE